MNPRQKRFFKLMPTGSCAIFFSNSPGECANRGWAGAFQQECNFWYLLPVDEEGSVLFLVKDHSDRCRTFLFCTPKDAHFERWHGQRLGCEGYRMLYPDCLVYSIQELGSVFQKILNEIRIVYCHWDMKSKDKAWLADQLQLSAYRHNFDGHLRDWRSLMQELRVVKDAQEIATVESACHITALAFKKVSEELQNHSKEWQIQADLYATFAAHGASPAYPAIVASGAHGLCLHYSKNASTLAKNSGLLIDAGCQYLHYASDVTRTFFKGEPSKAWKALYQLVKGSQDKAIKAIRPGISFNDLENIVMREFWKGLLNLSLLEGDPHKMIPEKVREFYPHSIGHWIGLEVHDLGPHPRGPMAVLKEGMLLTVEPGLYIPNVTKMAPFNGIAIRIEDVIVVTKDGARNLTASIPKNLQ